MFASWELNDDDGALNHNAWDTGLIDCYGNNIICVKQLSRTEKVEEQGSDRAYRC